MNVRIQFQKGWAECYEAFGKSVFADAGRTLSTVLAREQEVDEEYKKNQKLTAQLQEMRAELDTILAAEKRKQHLIQEYTGDGSGEARLD